MVRRGEEEEQTTLLPARRASHRGPALDCVPHALDSTARGASRAGAAIVPNPIFARRPPRVSHAPRRIASKQVCYSPPLGASAPEVRNVSPRYHLSDAAAHVDARLARPRSHEAACSMTLAGPTPHAPVASPDCSKAWVTALSQVQPGGGTIPPPIFRKETAFEPLARSQLCATACAHAASSPTRDPHAWLRIRLAVPGRLGLPRARASEAKVPSGRQGRTNPATSARTIYLKRRGQSRHPLDQGRSYCTPPIRRDTWSRRIEGVRERTH